MNGLDFLRLVLPPQGWYVGVALKGEARRQWSFPSIEALHAWCVSLDNQGWNVYYACASFRKEKVWDASKQKWRRRTHNNVLFVADLWADIDTRLSKANAPYADPQEAAEAVVAFCRMARLPHPLWVMSGGGLHIHWPLAIALPLDNWLILARLLKSAVAHFGLKIDPVRTADASSILRVPGTHHHKSGRTVQCSEAIERFALEQFEHLKEFSSGETHNRSRSVAVRESGPASSPLAEAIAASEFDAPSDPTIAVIGCRQLASWARSRGEYQEPFERHVAYLFKACGEQWRDTYLGYIDADWRNEAAAKFDECPDTGAPRCDRFESLNPGGCDGCPWRGTITSPIQIGRQAQKTVERKISKSTYESTIQSSKETLFPQAKSDGFLNGFPILGQRWAIDDKHRICEAHEKPDGDMIYVAVSEHPIYVESVHNSEALGRCSYTFKHRLPNEGWRTIDVPADSMGLGRGVPELMAHGVIIHNPKLFMEYTNDQIGVLDRKPGQLRMTKFEQCGWKKRDFLNGTELYKGDGSVFRAVCSEELETRRKLGLMRVENGDARVWVSCTNQLFTPDHYCAWTNIGASFGSVFMPWCSKTEGGVLFSNVTPETGQGKTKILQAGAAIWGQWNALSIKDYDTSASQGLILATLCNLPAFVDELAHFARDPQYGVLKLREFLDKFNAGIDKHRALIHGMGLRHQLGQWQLIMQASANQSIIDLIEVFGNQNAGGVAPAMRIHEMDATPPKQFDKMLGDRLDPTLWENAGWAGDAFLQHLMRPDIYKVAHEQLKQWTELLWGELASGPEQRFRVRGLACSLTGLSLGKDCGLIPRDLDLLGLLQWNVNQIRTRTSPTVAKPTQEAAIQALNQFLSANVSNTLRVQYAFKARVPQAAIGQKPQKLVLRHELGSNRVYMAQKDFKAFLVNHGYPYTEVIKQLGDLRVLLNDRRMLTLGAGTEYASAQVPCIELDSSHPVLGSMVQEVENDNMDMLPRM